MTIPSAINMARKAIKDNPSLFVPGIFTEEVIVNLMVEYYEKCREYVNQDQPLINEIKETLNSLTKTTNP